MEGRSKGLPSTRALRKVTDTILERSRSRPTHPDNPREATGVAYAPTFTPTLRCSRSTRSAAVSDPPRYGQSHTSQRTCNTAKLRGVSDTQRGSRRVKQSRSLQCNGSAGGTYLAFDQEHNQERHQEDTLSGILQERNPCAARVSVARPEGLEPPTF